MEPIIRRSLSCLLAFTLVLGACKKAPPSQKHKREEAAMAASRERRKITNFANAIRKVLEWRQEQPLSDSEEARRALIKAVAAKMDEVPHEGMPANLEQAWKDMLNAWHKLAATASPDEALAKQGAAAAEKVNAFLVANGYPDLRL